MFIIRALWFFASGWTPQTFTSSRKNRAEMKKQSIYSFLDEEDIKVHDVLLSHLIKFDGYPIDHIIILTINVLRSF